MIFCTSADYGTIKREQLLVESSSEDYARDSSRTAAVTGSNRERNVVRMRAAVSFGRALRDIPKDGCEGG